jgi:2-dehydro-3-deoxyphosphooctonate aldolase (KDO 8-P synthase)
MTVPASPRPGGPPAAPAASAERATAPRRASIEVGGRTLGGGPLFLIAGPCALEQRALAFEIGRALREIAGERGLALVFKASYDKANRTSLGGGRGLGLEAGLELLGELREQLALPVLTDVHAVEQCELAARHVDVLQIPAFLCRQTDLLVAAAHTGCAVNVKKGQFLAPWDMQHVARKITDSGNPRVIVTERGTSFGYGRLVVDMSGFEELERAGHPVVFDATHSVQRPGGMGERSGGDRSLVPALARAAVATGHVDGLFFEVHPDPDSSPSDGPNMLRLADFPRILDEVLAVHAALARARTG